MTLLQIGVLAALASIIGQLKKGRETAILGVSALTIFWLQPDEPLSSLRFWFPVATLALAVVAWSVTAGDEGRSWAQNWRAAATLVAVLALVALGRYLPFAAVGFAIAPSPLRIVVVAAACGGGAVLVLRWRRANRIWLHALFFSLLITFVVLKTPAYAAALKSLLLSLSVAGQASSAGNAVVNVPIAWLGFSYFAFRVLHTVRDRQSGRLPAASLGEYASYVLFFPAFTAGPIDRLEHFSSELDAQNRLTDQDWIEAGTRLFVGLFKKFVIADLLAVISISDVLVTQTRTAGWLWLFLYAYALRIYFDFSGYTDIAIGVGRLMGIRLPENFSAPYLKPNLTQFWNSWHITLTQWFRSYAFNPLTRWLRSSEHTIPAWLIILVAQVGTMLLIGLWHGVTWGFAAWGAWHGVGLFLHNRWNNLMRSRVPTWAQGGIGGAIAKAASIFLTFNFVALGWLFFQLSSPAVAWSALLRLFGVA